MRFQNRAEKWKILLFFDKRTAAWSIRFWDCYWWLLGYFTVINSEGEVAPRAPILFLTVRSWKGINLLCSCHTCLTASTPDRISNTLYILFIVDSWVPHLFLFRSAVSDATIHEYFRINNKLIPRYLSSMLYILLHLHSCPPVLCRFRSRGTS